MDFFKKSKNLYEKAANAAGNTDKKMLLKFSSQTSNRLEEIKNEHLKNHASVEKIRLQKSSGSSTEWMILNEHYLSSENDDYTKKDNPSKNRKRKNEESVSLETKKQKKISGV